MNINRFPRVGQNTPLTCVFMGGFEFNDQARDKIQSASAYNNLNSPTPHQNAGNGGSRFMSAGSSTGAFTLGFPLLKEFVICAAVQCPSSTGIVRVQAYDSVGAAIQTMVSFTGTTGTVAVVRGTSSVLATSAVSSFATATWNWAHMWLAIDNTTGFGHVRIGSWANEVVSVTGVDTQNTANTTADTLQLSSAGATSLAYLDDVMVFARSMYYHGATGTVPSAGSTIVGGTSGATAVITNVFDNGSGSGCFFVKTVSGTFVAAETITQGGWSGTAGNGLGNNEASLWVKEQYIMLATTSADISTGWTNSTGASHFTEVDDAATTSDFVSTNTAGQTDEYATTITLPPGAEIEAVCVSAYARLNGVSSATNLRVGIDDGAADIDMDADSPLSGSWEVHDMVFTNNPNTGVKYTTTEIGNLNLRITSKA